MFCEFYTILEFLRYKIERGIKNAIKNIFLGDERRLFRVNKSVKIHLLSLFYHFIFLPVPAFCFHILIVLFHEYFQPMMKIVKGRLKTFTDKKEEKIDKREMRKVINEMLIIF